MENATKGLMIAGSVLLAILVLGMLIYFYSSLKSYPIEEQKLKEKEQITKFNAEYESYQKKEMYGTDVVTIINKAINNNKKYVNPITGKYVVGENNYYIDVEIVLQKPVASTAIRYSQVDSGFEDSDELIDAMPLSNTKIRGKINGKGKDVDFELKNVFEAKKPINILEQHKDTVILNKDIADFFESFESVKINNPDGKFDSFNYTVVFSGFTDFKRKYFECSNIEYNNSTGRVNKLIFKEISDEENTNTL